MLSKVQIDNGPLTCICYNSDFEYLAIGTQNRFISIISSRSGKILSNFKGHTYEVSTVHFNPNHSQLCSGGREKQAFIWDVASHSIIQKLAGHFSPIMDVKFCDENLLITSSLDGEMKAWDIRAKTCLQTFSEASDSVISLEYNDKYIYTGSADGILRTYDLRQAQLYVDEIGSVITDIQILKSNNGILTLSQDGVIRLLDRYNGKLCKFHEVEKYSENLKCKVGFNEKWIIFGTAEGSINIFDQNFELINELPAHSNSVQSISAHATENRFASIGQDGFLNLYFKI
eukprot:NODE_330_length_9451_cov_0.342173.p5 type:complete len:287 gc:universal NODE_330_length_9451_cov_0.342173:6611-5751(-)